MREERRGRSEGAAKGSGESSRDVTEMLNSEGASCGHLICNPAQPSSALGGEATTGSCKNSLRSPDPVIFFRPFVNFYRSPQTTSFAPHLDSCRKRTFEHYR